MTDLAGIAPAAAGGRWRDLRLRALSALVLAPLAVGCIWFGGVPWLVLMAAGSVALVVEWTQLCGHGGVSAPAILASAAVLASGALLLDGRAGLALVPLVAGVSILAGLPVARRGRLAFGLLYVGLPCLALLFLRADPLVGRGNLLFAAIVVWTTDIGAYIAGRLIGGPKLAPSISPGKTVSGAVGALVIATLAGLACSPRGALVAAVLSVVAQAGDLFESGLKRRFGVKDSGRLIPGHGGLLDRVDGLLAAAPVACLLALMLGQGGALWR